MDFWYLIVDTPTSDIPTETYHYIRMESVRFLFLRVSVQIIHTGQVSGT